MKKYKNLEINRLITFINDCTNKRLFAIEENKPLILDFKNLHFNGDFFQIIGVPKEVYNKILPDILITAENNNRSVDLRAKQIEENKFVIEELNDNLGEDINRALKAQKLLFLFRHGQTDFNIKGLTQGAEADEPLNETGEKQASDLSYLFKDKAVHFFSSPQIRARKTGELLLKEAKLLSNEDDEHFSEIHLERFNGEPLLHAPLNVFYFPILPETEDPEFLYQRVDEGIKNISKKTSEDSVVVSHGCALGNWLYRKTGNQDLVLDKNLDCIIVDGETQDILVVNPDQDTLKNIIDR